MLMDRLAEAINTIKANERVGRRGCTVLSTKLVRSVLDVMQKNGYIDGYEERTERYARVLDVKLSRKINSISVVKPRYALSKLDIQRYEERYIPSKDFGILIISTPKGMLTNRDARAAGIGGRLVAYVY